MQNVRRKPKDEGGHWYTAEGFPMHKVPYKDPSKGFRSTTVRDARKLDLYASVNTIGDILKRAMLDNWQKNLVIETCYLFPKYEGESLSNYNSRIMEAYQLEASKAPEEGTAIHNAIEAALQRKPYDLDYQRYVEMAERVIIEQEWKILHLERRLVPKLCGYGGTADLLAEDKFGNLIIGDWKSKETKKKKILVYPSYKMQLCGYKQGFAVEEEFKKYENILMCDIFLSKDEDRKEVIWVDKEDEVKYTKIFNWCNKIFREEKGLSYES